DGSMLTVATLTAPPCARRMRPRSCRAFRSLRIVTSEVLKRLLRPATVICPCFSSSSRILVLRSRFSIELLPMVAEVTNESKRKEPQKNPQYGSAFVPFCGCFEDRVIGGANRACFLTKCRGDDLDLVAQWAPFKTVQNVAEWLKQSSPRLSYAAADDHDLGIESVDERSDRDPHLKDRT